MVDTPVTPALPTGHMALFLDADGTLIDIAPRPDAVVVPPDLIAALARLDDRLGGALALVSGRTIADLDRLFAPLRLRASGVHGAEMRLLADGAVSDDVENKLPASVVGNLRAVADRHPGTLVEDKGFSVAIHYRANPAAGPDLGPLLAALAAASGLQLLPGHMVFEVKNPAFNKGSAIAAFMRQPTFAGRQPIFIGDDVTDLPGFEAVLAAGGLAYAVSTPRQGVSGHFPRPEDVRTWVTAWAARAC